MAFTNEDVQEIKEIVLETIAEESDPIEDVQQVSELSEGDEVPIVRSSQGVNSYGRAPVNLFGGGGGGEPAQYIKDASVSQDGNTLTLTKKNNSTVTFAPNTGGGTGTVTGVKVGSEGSVINPTQGVVTIPPYESGAQAHKAPTQSEVKTALETVTTSQGKFLRDDGTWQTPPSGGGNTADVNYDATNKKITKTINGATSDVVTVNKLKADMALKKSDVELGNVGNFKAVSTVANQGLSDTEKENARKNIGAGTSDFSGSYNDLSDKPTIPAGVTVDTELSKTSVNPVQNKVIAEALETDKAYEPSKHSGLGRKTLKLKEDGSNILTQEDFEQENTIYVIQYDFELNGETIEIPEGCMLEFKGGKIDNGKLIGNETKIVGDKNGSTGLYGVYYDTDNYYLDFNYTNREDFVLNECHSFIDENLGLEETNYQSIVRYGNYLFLLGSIWGDVDTQDGQDRTLRIRVFSLPDAQHSIYSYIGTAHTTVRCHANGACVAGNKLYVASSKATSADIYIFNCDDIVSVCEHGDTISNTSKNMGYLSEDMGFVINSWVTGIDYDENHQEFAVNFNNIIGILDKDFNYIRKTLNFVTGIQAKFNFQVGVQDIIYKNGIIYCNLTRWGSENDATNKHIVFATIDSTTGKVINYNDVEYPLPYLEGQGGFKDTESDSIWIICKYGHSGLINWHEYNMICKVSSEELEGKDKSSLASDSINKPFIQNADYIHIYIDNNTTNTVQDGTYNYPFKTFQQAILFTKTCSDNVTFLCKKSAIAYTADFGSVVNKVIGIRSYGTNEGGISEANIKINGLFYNCYISIKYVRLILESGNLGYKNAAIALFNCKLACELVKVVSTDRTTGAGFIYSSFSDIHFYNFCKFLGLPYVIFSNKHTTCNAISCVFREGNEISDDSLKTTNFIIASTYERIGNDNVDGNVAELSIQDMYFAWYRDIDLVIRGERNAVGVCPSPMSAIRIWGYTCNNAAIANLIARKYPDDYPVIATYIQERTAEFTEENFTEEVLEALREEFPNPGRTPENPNYGLTLTGYLEKGIYNYYYTGFESGSQVRLGCRRIGTTEQRPDNLPPFILKLGSQYIDTTLNGPVWWTSNGWVGAGGSNPISHLYGKTVFYLADSIIGDDSAGEGNHWADLLTARYNLDTHKFAISGNALVAPENYTNPNTGFHPAGAPMASRYTAMLAEGQPSPDYIIVCGGTNDYNAQYPLADFRTGLESLITNLINSFTPNSNQPPYCRIGFVTPWMRFNEDAIEDPAYDHDTARIKMEEYVRVMVEVCNRFSIPVFDCAHDSGVAMYNSKFRSRYTKAAGDRSHFNANGHKFFLPKIEHFITSI